MASCPDRLEALWLDVYGELDPKSRPALEKHLLVCEACRKEREQLIRLIQQVKENAPSSVLTPERAASLTNSIMQELRNEWGKNCRRKKLFTRHWVLIPAVAAASIIIVAFAWLSFKDFNSSSGRVSTALLQSDPQLIAEDLDVIKNMEFLEEMEALQELIKFVDTQPYKNSRIQKLMKEKIEHDKMQA